MTERLEPLKLKRRIIKALARRSSGFSESPPPFFHPAPPTYIFFLPFFLPPQLFFFLSLFRSFFPFFDHSSFFSPSRFFFIFLFFFIFYTRFLFLSLSLFHSLVSATTYRGKLRVVATCLLFSPRPCRDFKTQECDRVQPSSGVARGRRENCAILSRHLPISRYVNWESRENSWGTESRSIRRNNAHRFCALSMETMKISNFWQYRFTSASIAWKILFNIKCERTIQKSEGASDLLRDRVRYLFLNSSFPFLNVFNFQ